MITYDLEQFSNFHSFTGVDDKNTYQFVIHEKQNDIDTYINFLQQLKKDKISMIGFNNIGYDAHLINVLLRYDFKNKTPQQINDILYKVSKKLITENKYCFCDIPQIDLFRIYHLHNKARATSLKSLEVVMRWHSVEDLPFTPEHLVKEEEIDEVLSYNLNDVLATKEFYKLCEPKIALREQLGIPNSINLPDVSLGEKILKLKLDKVPEVQKYHTPELLKIKDIIFDTINVTTSPVLDFFNSLEIMLHSSNEKKNYSHMFGKLQMDYGLGGVHGVQGKGIWKADNTHTILSIDVASLYPSIIVNHSLEPKALIGSFNNAYSQLREDRLKAKEEDNMLISDAYKLSLNGTYG